MIDPLDDVMAEGAQARPGAPPDPDKREERADWFLIDIFEVKVKLGPRQHEIMVQGAMRYLMAGRPMEWRDWSLLSAASREAFTEAAQKIAVLKELKP